MNEHEFSPPLDKPSDHEAVFDSFWKEIICNPDGTLNLDQVKRELSDYHDCIENVSKVYMHITVGLLSKPNYLADGVISASDDYSNKVANVDAEREINAVLAAVDPKYVVRVCEAGGLENVFASLAVTVAKMNSRLKEI